MPKAKKTSKDGLTVKQRKFLKFYLQSGNVSQSALRAGYALSHSGFENLTKPLVQFAFQMLLEQKGISDERLRKVLDEGLDSTKVVGYIHQYKQKGKKGKVEKIQPDEIIGNEFLDVPDMPTRHKYLETAYKVKGQFKEKVELTGEGGEGIHITYKIARPPKRDKKKS